MRPTRWWVLVLLAAVAGAAGYLVTTAKYAEWQSPPALAPVWLLLLGLTEAYTASMTRARMRGRPGTKPINPLVVARLAALAKATSPVGALAAGAYAGFLVHVARTPGPVAHHDTRTGALGVGCSLGLVAGALLLEWACRVRRSPDDEEPPAP